MKIVDLNNKQVTHSNKAYEPFLSFLALTYYKEFCIVKYNKWQLNSVMIEKNFLTLVRNSTIVRESVKCRSLLLNWF